MRPASFVLLAVLLLLPTWLIAAGPVPEESVQDTIREDTSAAQEAAAARETAVATGVDSTLVLVDESEPISVGPLEETQVAEDGAADADAPVSVADIVDEDEALDHDPDTESAPLADGDAPAAQGSLEEDSALIDAGDGGPMRPEQDTAARAEENGAAVASTLEEALFPTSPVIERQKAFWIQIFTRYTSHQGLIHDGRIAMPVYESVDLTGMKYRAQRRFVRARKREIAANLRRLASALQRGDVPDADGMRLLAILPPDASPDDIREYARNVRFQRGLADRFREGVIRSGAVFDEVRRIMAANGVPRDLVYLPHVESSYNYKTRSKYGAAGIWQFTRGTGRIFMDVRYEVDERLDPIIASHAAAKFLRQNYDKLGSWPLAITAYNHGPQSLAHIVRREGTHELGELIRNYHGRLFRFASKNFYAEFLAAREVASNYEAYFGPLDLEPPLRFTRVELPFYVAVDDVVDALDVSAEKLRRLNPALRHPVWSGSKYIPQGYVLRLPAEVAPDRFLTAIPATARRDEQKRSAVVRVERGDSLYSIGRRLGISWRAIAEANNISAYHRLMPGQKLVIPYPGVELPKPEPRRELQVVKIDPEELESRKARLQQLLEAVNGRERGESDNDLISAAQFQELKVVRYDPDSQVGEIVAAYGETLGHYSEWAGATTQEIRRLNGMSYRTALRPGSTVLVPLDHIGPEVFGHKRLAYHLDRMEEFFSRYRIAEVVKVKVQRGQSPWDIAQNNNVPMWLFYRENPHLLSQPMQPGMAVTLPVVQAAQN